MDLSALLAREGIEAGDVDALVKWARQRSAALVARIEPGSAVAEALGELIERTRDPNAPPNGVRTPSRSAPRPIARSVSRPYLNAAVEAALSGKQEDLDLALETAAAESAEARQSFDEPALEQPVAAEPEPSSEPIDDENDPSIGGFNRFAFSFRRRALEQQQRQQQEAEEAARRQTLSRGFELQAEPSPDWDEQRPEVPAPPGFEARAPEAEPLPDAQLGDSESSGGLVLGIPDDDVDIPVQRGRPRSAGISPDASSSALTDAAFDALVEPSGLAFADETPPPPRRGFTDDEPPPPPRPAFTPAPARAREDLAFTDDEPPLPTGAFTDDEPTRASDGPAFTDDEPSLPIREDLAFTDDEAPLPGKDDLTFTDDELSPPRASAHEKSAPQSRTSPISGPKSGPQVITLSKRVSSGPQSRPHSAPPPPPPPRPVSTASRAAPPPPPVNKKGRGKTTQPYPPVAAAAVAAEPEKKGKQRKKVVDLSQPVARPISAPAPAALPITPAPAPVSEEILAAPPRAPTIPDYLRDDDE